jgi:hypothetical protein
LKDLAHTLRINDLRVILRKSHGGSTQLLPAWTLQRFGLADVVPDLLAVWRTRAGEVRSILACEIDLNTESLSRVFQPKLVRLAGSIAGLNHSAVLVLTSGNRRAATLRDFASQQLEGAAFIVETLPRTFGLVGLAELQKSLSV